MQVNPILLMVPATLSGFFAFMLPVATPPNAIVFGSNRVSVGEMAWMGLVFNFIGLILVTVAISVFDRTLLGIDLDVIPS